MGILAFSITLGLVLLLGFSYAFFTLTLNGTKQNTIKVGKLSLNLTDQNPITVNNMVPTYTNVALGETPYTFTVTNDGTVDADYQIYLDNTGTLTDLSYFDYALKKDGKILKLDYLTTLSNSLLSFGTLHPGESSTFELYIWLDANTTTEDLSSLTGTYESTIRIESTQRKEKKLSSYIVHACDGKTDCIKEVGDTAYFQNSYYNSSNIKYIWYSGKMWTATGYDSNGNVKAVTSTEQAYIPWGTTLDYKGSYVETWLNEEFLPTLNNCEKLLVTDYAWNYSSETGSGFSDPIGTDKIVQAPVGLLNKEEIYYGSDQDTSISSDDWILNMLGKHYYTLTPTISNKIFVGGLGHMAYGDYALNNDKFAGVLPSIVFKNNVIVISGNGTLENPYHIKGDAKGKNGDLLNTRSPGEYVAFGDGINSSYRISAIEDGKVKLISTDALKSISVNSSGDEEWDFLNRIRLSQQVKGSYYPYPYKVGSGDYLHYDANSTDYPLAYFLNHEFLNPSEGYLSLADKNMLMMNQTFYTGTLTGSSNYTSAKDSSKAVTATVGLPVLGETFTIPQREETISSTFSSSANKTVFMTNNGTSLYGMFLSNYLGTSMAARDSFRPSLYLKNNVKIKGGSGTKSDPYILTME